MNANELSIIFNVDPIVKLSCLNEKCEHNLVGYGFAACNLKHVAIGSNGECQSFEPLKDKAQRND